MPDFAPATSTLQNIITKVRQLTRSPSDATLTDQTIVDNVNTFITLDFPQHLRLEPLLQNITWYCQPNIDTYATNSVPGLTDFNNYVISIDKPMYIAGYQALVVQSQEEFYAIWPKLNSILSIGLAGDGVTTTFSGTLQQIPVLQNSVLFDSIDANNNGLILVDYPVTSEVGALGLPDAPQTIPSPYGSINYITGAFSLNFPTAPGVGEAINSQTVPYVASRPQSILFFNQSFTLRPIPDQPYRIDIQVFVQPSQLLDSSSNLELNQWWQYIAYGAAKKIFEDRMDLESVQQIMPEYIEQRRLCTRSTIQDLTSQRSSTVYTQQVGPWAGFWGSIGGNGT